jgi:nucleotide-binding universal stress UspA family protein
MVPLDKSQRAEQAVPVAAQLARAFAGTVVLVEIVQGLIELEVGAVSPSLWAPPARPQDRKHAEAYLKSVAASDQVAGVATEIGVYAGPAAATLLLAAHEQHADLMIMTTRGLTGLKRWALGSVAEKVAHASEVPVLLLHEQEDAPVSSAFPLDRACILVPLDGSILSEAAIMPAAFLVRGLRAAERGTLHLVRVLDEVDVETSAESLGNPQTTPVAAREWALQQAREYLTATAARVREALGEPAPLIAWSVVVNPQKGSYEADVASAILRTAEEGEPVAGATAAARCAAIAMATHGRSGLQRWALGSVTERVLHATKLPLLIVPPRSAHP